MKELHHSTIQYSKHIPKLTEPVNIDALISESMSDTSGKWMSKDHVKDYTNKIVKLCIDAVENTPTTHASTTYDSGLIEATLEKSIKNIKYKFGYHV